MLPWELAVAPSDHTEYCLQRHIRFFLKNVSPTPATLRESASVDAPAAEASVNLAQLFQHYYFDSYPAGPPNPDPSRFEYLTLITASADFRFHAHVEKASTVKRRALVTELGQAFCRCILHDHFRIVYFAHISDVLGKATHAAFEGMKIERIEAGDVPDYLCARKVTEPYVAEAKGRFSKISFDSSDWNRWRRQFHRICATNRRGESRQLKGFTVATMFVSDAQTESARTTAFIEDPITAGRSTLSDTEAPLLGRVISAVHYARVFSKLGLGVIAAALANGYVLTPELSFSVPTWVCQTPPFEGRRFIGGYYQTAAGLVPQLDQNGRWIVPAAIGTGHVAFVGLEVNIAERVAAAARGDWEALDRLNVIEPVGMWSSEFGWLLDGTVLAPVPYFLPIGFTTL